MATANIIQVPVSELDVMEFLGYEMYRKATSLKPLETLSVTLKLRTAASPIIFKRRVRIYDARLRASFDRFLEAFGRHEEPDDLLAVFYCEIGAQEFYGLYDYETHTGKLTAHVTDEILEELFMIQVKDALSHE